MIANKLNTFFINIGPKLASQIKTHGNSTYETFLKTPTVHRLHFNKISEVAVINAIDKLPAKPSCGHII